MENVQLIENEVKLKTRKTLLWFGIISIIMLFAGLTSAYIVRQSEGKWAQFELPWTFMISTVVIILSSVPMELSLKSIKKGNSRDLVKWLVLTLLLGFGFVVAQYFAWSELFGRGIAFSSHISDIKTGYT
ncbi:MAG: heme-copper oxidase subunit III, partial [Bacteroidota bacterium]